MADKNFDPNARYNTGLNAAGTGRQASDAVRQAAAVKGLNTDGTVGGSELSSGPNCAGSVRSNTGPNVAGAQKSINAT